MHVITFLFLVQSVITVLEIYLLYCFTLNFKDNVGKFLLLIYLFPFYFDFFERRSEGL